MQNKSRAFTLIELLVVVLIIGILAAIAVPQYQKAVLKARLATIKSLAAAIAQAQEVYYMANNEYAGDLEKLDVALPAGKKEDSTAAKYKYDWGWCSLANKSDFRSVQCYIGDKISYQINLNHSASPTRSLCVGWNTDINSLENQVCKSETADKNPNIQPTYIAWYY